MASITFVTDTSHKREPSKGNWAPFFCTSRASLRKQDVLWETSSVAKGEEKRLFYFSSFPFGCFMQAQRLESRLLSFMSKYKDLYWPRNTPWISVRVCTRTKQDMTQWSSKVRPCSCPVVVGCAMSPRSHRILLTCPFPRWRTDRRHRTLIQVKNLLLYTEFRWQILEEI